MSAPLRVRLRLSVTARITLLALALALASSLTLIGVIWRHAHGDALGLVRRETTERATELAAVWAGGGPRALADAIRHARAPGDESLLLALLDRDGRRRFGFAPPRIGVTLRPTEFAVADIDASPTLREAGYALRPVGDGWLIAGRSLDSLRAEEGAIERALGIVLLIALAFGVAAGVVVARYVARRLDAIADVIDAAAAGDLSLRVAAPPGSGDAFDRLAQRLNTMLARIERLMGELRVVTDSLAHDLRSPLARLRTRAEQAVTAEPAAREAALGGLLAEADLVMAMLTTVIEISRSEAASRDRFAEARPGALIAELAELYEPVMEEAGQRFAVAIDEGVAPMPLHRELLSQAVANLLDNALRHGAAGGEVTLRLARIGGGDGGGVAIAVEDRGPGIAEADRPQALKRFGRLDSARSTPGAGLGMTLVDAVARLHGGRVELADNAPGLVARIVLPG